MTPHTRSTVAAGIGRFLHQLWRRARSSGQAPGRRSRYVCDDTNNPPATRAMGQLIADLALAPSTPFEYVLLRTRPQRRFAAMSRSGA